MSDSLRLAANDDPRCAIAAPAPARIEVFDDILVPYQTPVRRPLAEWVKAIRGRFCAAKEQAKSNLAASAQSIIISFNEAALVETYFGREKQASALCAGALQWLKRHSSRPGAFEILHYAFEPFLNLARLDRIHRRYTQALSKIELIDKVVRGQGAQLGDLFVPGSLCRQFFAGSSELPRLTRTTYILEWVKVLIKWKQYKQAEAFNPDWQSPADLTARDAIWEGRIVALCCLERFDDALAVGSPALLEQNGLNRSLFLFRRAETFAAAGRIDDASRVAGNLARTFLGYPGTLGMTRLGLLVRLNVLLAKLGAECAPKLAGLGLKWATVVGDIRFQCEFLNLMADLGEGDATALRWQANNLRRNGLYGAGKNGLEEAAIPIEELTVDLLRFACGD